MLSSRAFKEFPYKEVSLVHKYSFWVGPNQELDYLYTEQKPVTFANSLIPFYYFSFFVVTKEWRAKVSAFYDQRLYSYRARHLYSNSVAVCLIITHDYEDGALFTMN